MCKGMLNRNNQRTMDAEKLTWKGSKDAGYEKRRKKLVVTDSVEGSTGILNRKTGQNVTNIHQHPPMKVAMVPAVNVFHGSRTPTQGHQIRSFASKTRCALSEDDKFVIRIEGGCSYFGLGKRSTSETTTAAGRLCFTWV